MTADTPREPVTEQVSAARTAFEQWSGMVAVATEGDWPPFRFGYQMGEAEERERMPVDAVDFRRLLHDEYEFQWDDANVVAAALSNDDLVVMKVNRAAWTGEARAAGLREAAQRSHTPQWGREELGCSCGWDEDAETSVAYAKGELPDHAAIWWAHVDRALLAAPGAAPAEGRALDVAKLREAARRAGLPREVSAADIEDLADEYDRLAAPAEPATEGEAP